jgi:hypothetical protein
MLVLRIFGALLLVTLGVSFVGFVLTRDRRWLRFSWKILIAGVVISLIFIILYMLERLIVVV